MPDQARHPAVRSMRRNRGDSDRPYGSADDPGRPASRTERQYCVRDPTPITRPTVDKAPPSASMGLEDVVGERSRHVSRQAG